MVIVKNNSFRRVLKYSIIKYVALAAGFIKGVVNAKFLGPELVGVLGSLTLVLSYCLYTNLGILNAMNSEYVLYKDKEPKKAKEVIETSFTFLILLSAIFICISLISLIVLERENRVYFFFIFIIAIFEQFRSFYINYARLVDNYRLINIIELIYNIVALIITFLLIRSLKIIGVLIPMLTCGIVIYIVSRRILGRIKLKINKIIFKELIIVGIPLLIYNLGFYILTTIDRWIIIKNLDYTQLGYYTFANQIVSATLVFVNSMLFLYYPKAIKKYNDSNNSNDLIVGAIKESTRLLEVASSILILLGLIIFYPFVKLLIPQFIEATNVYYILLLAVISNTLAYFANVYIVSNKKQFYLVLLQVIAIILNLGLNLIFVNIGLGLIGVALATMISNIMYSLIQHIIFSKIKTGRYEIYNSIKVYVKIIIYIILVLLLVFCDLQYAQFCMSIIVVTVGVYLMDYIKIINKIKNKEIF